MNGLKMHWRLIQESDGRRHLNMHWEPTHSCRIRSFARAQIHKNAKSHARLQSTRVVHSSNSLQHWELSLKLSGNPFGSSTKRAVSVQTQLRQHERCKPLWASIIDPKLKSCVKVMPGRDYVIKNAPIMTAMAPLARFLSPPCLLLSRECRTTRLAAGAGTAQWILRRDAIRSDRKI